MRKIRVSYEIVTPESAAEGDAAERGWEDEEGTEIVPDEYDLDEYETEEKAAVELACTEILQHGSVEASDYPKCQPGHTWYTTIDAEENRAHWERGEDKRYSFHLDGFSEAEELAIYARVS